MAETYLDPYWGLRGERGQTYKLIYSNPNNLGSLRTFRHVLDARPNIDIDRVTVIEGASIVAWITLLDDVMNLGTAFPQTILSGNSNQQSHDLLHVYRRSIRATDAETAIRGTVDDFVQEAKEAVDKTIISTGETTQRIVDEKIRPALGGASIAFPILIGVGIMIYFFGIRGNK